MAPRPRLATADGAHPGSDSSPRAALPAESRVQGVPAWEGQPVPAAGVPPEVPRKGVQHADVAARGRESTSSCLGSRTVLGREPRAAVPVADDQHMWAKRPKPIPERDDRTDFASGTAPGSRRGLNAALLTSPVTLARLVTREGDWRRWAEFSSAARRPWACHPRRHLESALMQGGIDRLLPMSLKLPVHLVDQLHARLSSGRRRKSTRIA